jgi:hypothetical protein
MVKKKGSPSPPKKSSIEDRIKDLMDMNMPLVTTLYGRGGTGKTTIASFYPKPMLFIDVKDKGTESAKHKNLKRGDVKVFEVKDLDDIYEIYDHIVDSGKYKSVIIDHMTALQEISHNKVKEEEGKDQMSQRMFGVSAGYLKEIVQMYKGLGDMGIDPVFLCQDRLQEGDGEGDEQLLPEVGAGLMPSVATFLNAASRIIGHTYLYETMTKTGNMQVHREIEYRLRLGPNPYYVTKFTRPRGTPCPQYLTIDVENGNPYEDLQTILRGEWKAPTVTKKPNKKKGKKVKK